MVGSGISYSTNVSDCATASMAIDKMMKEMFGDVEKQDDKSTLTPLQKRQVK